MMKSTVLFILIFSFSLTYAQNPYPEKEDALLVLNSKLVVQLLDENCEIAELQNAALKQIFKDNWTDTEVEFLNKKQIEVLKNSKNNNYAFLTQTSDLIIDNRRRNRVRENKVYDNGNYLRTEKKLIGSYEYTAFTFAHYNFMLEIVKEGKIETVTKIGFGNGDLTSIDYLYLCQQLINLLRSSVNGVDGNDFYNVEQNIEDIKMNKLVLLEDMFTEREQKRIPKRYEYEYEIVDSEKYQEIILNKQKGHYYIKIIWSNQHEIYVWVTVDSEDGSIKSILGFGGISFGSNHTANATIKSKHLQYITQFYAQNMNNRY